MFPEEKMDNNKNTEIEAATFRRLIKHFQERINIYTEEEFDYEMHNIDLKE